MSKSRSRRCSACPASVLGRRSTSPCAPCIGRMRSPAAISCCCGLPMPVKDNSRSSPKAGARGGRTPLIIFGSHWEFSHECVHHDRKPDRPSVAPLRWYCSDRSLYGAQPQGAVHRRLGRGRLGSSLGGGRAAIDRVLRRHSALIRFAPAFERHGLPAARVARIDRNTLWRDLELWGAGEEN